jgi:small multidrug resistance family-3 protein
LQERGQALDILRTVLLFVLAGLAEIGGGWLVWQWLHTNWELQWDLLGGAGNINEW